MLTNWRVALRIRHHRVLKKMKGSIGETTPPQRYQKQQLTLMLVASQACADRASAWVNWSTMVPNLIKRSKKFSCPCSKVEVIVCQRTRHWLQLLTLSRLSCSIRERRRFPSSRTHPWSRLKKTSRGSISMEWKVKLTWRVMRSLYSMHLLTK